MISPYLLESPNNLDPSTTQMFRHLCLAIVTLRHLWQDLNRNHNANGVVSDLFAMKWAKHIFAWAQPLIVCKKMESQKPKWKFVSGKKMVECVWNNGFVFVTKYRGFKCFLRKFSPPSLGHLKIFELPVVFRRNLRAAPSSHFLYHPASKVTQARTRRAAGPSLQQVKDGCILGQNMVVNAVNAVSSIWAKVPIFRKCQGDALKSETPKKNIKKWRCSMDSRFCRAILGYPWESSGTIKTRSAKKEPDSIWHRNGQSIGGRSWSIPMCLTFETEWFTPNLWPFC